MTVLARLGIANPGALVAAMQRRGLVQLPATGTRGALASWGQRHPAKARIARRKAERLRRLRNPERVREAGRRRQAAWRSRNPELANARTREAMRRMRARSRSKPT